MKLGKSIRKYEPMHIEIGKQTSNIMMSSSFIFTKRMERIHSYLFFSSSFYNGQHTFAFLHTQILECLFLMWTISLSLWCRRVFLSTGTSFYFFLHIGMHPTQQSLCSINLQMHKIFPISWLHKTYCWT